MPYLFLAFALFGATYMAFMRRRGGRQYRLADRALFILHVPPGPDPAMNDLSEARRAGPTGPWSRDLVRIVSWNIERGLRFPRDS